MLVVDASCLYEVLVGGEASEAVREAFVSDPDHAAPALIDAEVLGLIRRDLIRKLLDRTSADQAVADLGSWPGERYDHRLLLGRAWELRDSVRSWDALYVALAEAMGATLVTRDHRLGRAQGPECSIEVLTG